MNINIVKWFKTKLSVRGRALLLYERGMVKAKKQDQQGAIVDYSSAIDLPNAPTDIISMALFNRGLAQVATGEFGRGVDDLTAVLEMDGAPANVKKMARQKLAKRNSRIHGRKEYPDTLERGKTDTCEQ